MTFSPEEAGALIESVGKCFPDAVRLARIVSLATRIEPELLRQARLQLLHSVDSGAEADLWFSSLVESSTPVSLTLLPAVTDLLRRQLADSKESLDDAWRVLKDVHENAPAAIKLEERVTWKTLSGDAESNADIEKELMSVVSAIVTQNRSGLARWALRAVPRFPEEARQTKAAQMLILTAAAHLSAWHLLDQQIENNTLKAGFINDLRVVLPPDLGTVPIGVNLLLDSVQPDPSAKGGSSRRYAVQFSSPPSSELDEVVIAPATNPLMLEVSWGEASKQQIKHVSVYKGRTEELIVDASEVRIRTAGGDLYTLREGSKDNPAAFESRSTITRIPRPPRVGYVARHYSGGRDILVQLKAELAPGRTRVVQVWGPGGTGKTVIAAEAARSLLDDFQDRVVWLSAEGRADFNISTLMDGISEQLGNPDLRRLNLRSKTVQLKTMLASAPTLIVVDNFEMIKPAQQARCFSFLKNAKCLVLILSRKRIDGPYNLVLGRMLPDEAREFLERLIKEAQNPEAFQGMNSAHLFEVSENNPLIMQWLVAQIELTKDAHEVLDDIGQGKGDAMSRVFERSFNLEELGDDGRRVLLALALFVPSASRAALAEVAGFESDLERLNEAARRLITLQLINSVPEGRLLVEGLIRELSRKHLLSSSRLTKDLGAGDIRRRFVTYFLAYAQSHQEPSAENYDALEFEFENLLDALDIAYELRSRNEMIQIYVALSGFLDVRGYWDEALRRNSQVQKVARRAAGRMLPDLKLIAADILLRRQEFVKAQAAYKSALTDYTKMKNDRGVANALRKLGSIALEQGNLDEAARLYNESLTIARRLSDHAGVADNLHNLAIVAQARYDLKRAEELYRESLELSERLGDPRSVAVSYHQLGVITEELGKLDEAQRFFERSLEIKTTLGDQDGMAATLHLLGRLKARMAKPQEAEPLLGRALDIFDNLGSGSADEVRQDLASLQAPPESPLDWGSLGPPTLAKPITAKPQTKKGLAGSGPKSSSGPRSSFGRGGTRTKPGKVTGYSVKRRKGLKGGGMRGGGGPSSAPSSGRSYK